MDKRIKALFADYGKSFSALALQNQAQLYADTFVAAGPKGVISTTREEFLKNARTEVMSDPESVRLMRATHIKEPA